MHQKGFSLVEMMIALVLGMIVIGAALGVYISIFGANSSQMKYSRLNNELRAVMTQITRDVRRAGYNPGLNLANTSKPSLPSASEISSVSYYVDDAVGVETYDYRLSSGAIQARTNGGGWVNLTDPAVITITTFNVSATTDQDIAGNVCVTITDYDITIAGALVSDNAVQRILSETVRPRNETVSSTSTCL